MNHLRILKGVSLIILLLCACTEDYDILTNKSKDINIKSDLDIARNWYNQQQITHEAETRSDNLNVNPIPVLSGSPSWEYYAINRNDSLLVVDVDLTDRVCQDFVTKENWDFYQQTKEWKYRRSYTHFVYVKNYKTNTETGFLMTIIPSKFYTKTHADRINKNTYLHRDKYLFGSVLFHDLNGKFVNGWKYERGKVVGKIRKKRWDDFPNADRLVFRSIPARYEVAPQLYTPPTTRAGMEDDPLYDGGTFPDIIVTPDPKPNWGDFSPGGGWIDHNDDNIPHNNEDGYNHDNDGYINEPHDGGSGGYNPPPLTPPAKGKDFESKIGDKIVVGKLPATMEVQWTNGCVPAIMKLVYEIFGDNSKTEKGLIDEYCALSKAKGGTNNDIIAFLDSNTGGVELFLLADFVDENFILNPFIDLRNSIDRGDVVMVDVPSEMPNSAHNVLVMGYHTNGDFIYMDPEKGHLMEAPESFFLGNYYFSISRLK
ncbi:hypothetical protein [Bacteroides sp.]|uniref:hypothetical protein n=1 Tax=Bacteroides sp. TaxID=29523 RepID=UPI0025C1F594|nr:hypothetical protein [Bacteroides sp.]